MSKYYLFAGEASGDLHGSLLLRSLKSDKNECVGVGGPLMRQEGFRELFPMEAFQVMGFSDIIKSLPRLMYLFFRVKKSILTEKPDCLILIDYPGFNLRMAASLRKSGFQGRIVQYVAPTVWAHGKGRIEWMAAHFDLLLTLYPFEPDYFSETSLKVEYIGNPLLKKVRAHPLKPDWKASLGIPSDAPLLALFPGSRRGEIIRHLPYMLEAAAAFQRQHQECVMALSVSDKRFIPLYETLIQSTGLQLNRDLFLIPRSLSYELMHDATLALAKSGTVTLELALHRVPTLVLYALTPLNYLIAKYFLKLSLSHYCIVNILANKRVFPEYMGRHLPPITVILEEMQQLYQNEKRRASILSGCEAIEKGLEKENADHLAARLIVELTQC